MKVYFAIWIFISASFLHQYCCAADSSATDSPVSNLIESSNFTNLEKELKTTSDLISSHTTTSLPFTSLNSECESSDCDKKVNSSSPSTSNSSVAKVQWNLVNTTKSTTTYHLPSVESNAEEHTVSSSALGMHSSTNHSSVYNSSLHSSDNELDSDIKFENIDYVSYGADMSPSGEQYLDNNSTDFEVMPMATAIPLNQFDSLDENSTYDSESAEAIETMPYSQILNDTNTTAVDSSEITSSQTDSEIDFTTHYLTSTSDMTTLNTIENKTVTYHYVSDVPVNISDIYSSSKEISTEENNIQADDTVNNVPSLVTASNANVTVDNTEDNSTCITDCYDSASRIILSSTDDKYSTLPIIKTETSSENIHDIDTESDASVSKSTVEFMNKITIPVHYDDEYNSSEISDLDNSSEQTIHMLKESEITNTASNVNTSIHLNTSNQTTIETDSTDNSLKMLTDTTTNANILVITESVFNNNLNSDNFSDPKLNTTSSNKLHVNESEAFENIQDTSTEFFYTVVVSEGKDQYPVFPTDTQTPTTVSDLTTVLSASRSYRIDDFTGHTQGRSNPVASHEVPVTEVATQNISFAVTSAEADAYEKNSSLVHNVEDFSVYTTVDPKMNEVHSTRPAITSTEPTYLNNLNEISKYVSSSQTVSTSLPSLEEKSTLKSLTDTLPTLPTSIENSSETVVPHMTSDKFLTTTEENIENNSLFTEHIMVQLNTKTTVSEIENKETTTTATSSVTEGVLYSVHKEITSHDEVASDSDDSKPITGYYYTEAVATTTGSNITTIANPIETKEDRALERSETASTTYEEGTLDTVSASATHGIEVTSFDEISSSDYSETHRAGKHIPFSSTLDRTTTALPIIYNITLGTVPRQTPAETTPRDFFRLLNNQIRPEDLSPEERSNLVNAVIKIPDRDYSQEELNQKIVIIHLWLLHAIADEYKNASLNLSGVNETQLHDVEFENLPEILYVLPTPDILLPNISLTFVVHNKWRNATFPAEIIAAILNLHTEDLKRLVEIEEIHFSQGLLVQTADLFSVIIEKYGIILLATCLITVGMILFLICVVIYYRRKTRHSAHCLTDDKLHRNMQEAMGIDLNPAVIILQDEIREKAALNGNKIGSLDDDEGWLAPIGDVPVAEDNNAPFVQDTKL